MGLAVVILTFNEALHIERAIRSASEVACQTIIVDSGSTDTTTELASRLGATVLTNPFVTQAQQFQWALDNAPIDAKWVMRLDADEVIEADLVREINERLSSLPENITGVNLKRKHIFMDRWIKHGGRYPLTMLRIWRHGKAKVEQRWMDEHMLLTEGHAISFSGGFSDHNLNDISYFIEKHNKYATREAIDVLNKRHKLLIGDCTIDANSMSFAAAGKRWAKEKLYNSLPFWAGPTCYFLYRYFIQLGFLDGPEGLIYHSLQGWWYRFLVSAKVIEIERMLSGSNDRGSKLAILSSATGYSFEVTGKL